MSSYPAVVIHNDTRDEHVCITDLLFFDSFHALEEETLQEIITHRKSRDNVAHSTLSRVSLELGENKRMKKLFGESGSRVRNITYSQLYEEVIKYTIFTDGNLYVSF